MGPGRTAVPCAVVEYSPEERVLNSEWDVQRVRIVRKLSYDSCDTYIQYIQWNDPKAVEPRISDFPGHGIGHLATWGHTRDCWILKSASRQMLSPCRSSVQFTTILTLKYILLAFEDGESPKHVVSRYRYSTGVSPEIAGWMLSWTTFDWKYLGFKKEKKRKLKTRETKKKQRKCYICPVRLACGRESLLRKAKSSTTWVLAEIPCLLCAESVFW